jgi:hypothetical protein
VGTIPNRFQIISINKSKALAEICIAIAKSSVNGDAIGFRAFASKRREEHSYGACRRDSQEVDPSAVGFHRRAKARGLDQERQHVRLRQRHVTIVTYFRGRPVDLTCCTLGRAFGCEPKSLPLSLMFLAYRPQPARPTTTTLRPQSPTGLLRFYDSAG